MKFRKKPVVIDAIQWTGKNTVAVSAFMSGNEPAEDFTEDVLYITTLEGQMTARAGDWIIRGVKGEYYPCKPDIFKATYEPVV